MSKNLVVVESPAKANTISKYLGKDFEVLASYGHVRDLIPKEGAVDTTSFDMKYETIKKNKKHLDKIVSEAKEADALYLATDPDREGEAISWHVYQVLEKKKIAKDKPVHRIVFHEITKNAIDNALEHPRTLSMDLVNAQQARRALDYLVGFNLSPLLWKKIKRGLSAGRVQSPALRMIVEREREIEAFNPQEYWSLHALCAKSTNTFDAQLSVYDGKKLKQFDVENEQQASKIQSEIKQAAGGKLLVKTVDKKQRKRNPMPPFITSTMQQDASRKLGFSAQKTMRVAQQLYEGIDIGSGEVGLITYMRTDSVSVAGEAIQQMRRFIAAKIGQDYLPEKANYYRTKSKNAQEAHEAIRPTSIDLSPDRIKGALTSDQYRLYDLIWKRALASQMVSATINTVSVDLEVSGTKHQFRASGSNIAHPGFLKIYIQGSDEPDDENEEKMLPELREGENVDLNDVKAEQHFTKPPPRYTEASLIKSLEEFGIGRPSTYASIISTLLQRDYVELESKRFMPTDMGRVVNNFLTQYFSQYVDYEFTAQLEDKLDAVSRGEDEWVPLMKDFWERFSKQVDEGEKIPRSEANQSRELGVDPDSGKPVSARMGRYGPFVQLGSSEDDEKPSFASLRKDQSLENITLEEALKLFELPRHLGETEDGEEVSANIGRYGPYVRVGKTFVSLKEDDPHTVTLQRALELYKEHKKRSDNRTINEFDDGKIKVLNGRFGPYVTNGAKNAKIPKDKKPEELSREECVELLEKAPERKGRRRRKS